MTRRILGTVLALLLSASTALSQTPAPSSPSPTPQTVTEEKVTAAVDALEATTAELKRTRELRKAERASLAKLEAQVAEYKTSNKLLDEAYVNALKEITELRVSIAKKDVQIEALEERVEKQAKEITRLGKKVSKLTKIAGGLAAALALVVYASVK